MSKIQEIQLVKNCAFVGMVILLVAKYIVSRFATQLRGVVWK